jgi:hypothetical protein
VVLPLAGPAQGPDLKQLAGAQVVAQQQQKGGARARPAPPAGPDAIIPTLPAPPRTPRLHFDAPAARQSTPTPGPLLEAPAAAAPAATSSLMVGGTALHPPAAPPSLPRAAGATQPPQAAGVEGGLEPGATAEAAGRQQQQQAQALGPGDAAAAGGRQGGGTAACPAAAAPACPLPQPPESPGLPARIADKLMAALGEERVSGAVGRAPACSCPSRRAWHPLPRH